MNQLDDQNFDAEVLQAKGVVIVDFWAVWCAPCRALAPVIADISNDYAGKVKVCKLDIESSTEIPARYGIRSIPTVLFFKDGEVVDRTVGAVPKTIIASKIDALL